MKTLLSEKGMLVINAAGNTGGSSWQYITAPGDGDSVLTIGAVDAGGNYASFSSTGPTFDGRIKPNVAAQGLGTVTITTSGTTQSGNGTSFATPVIAGMSACLWQANPTAGNKELYAAIEHSGDQYSAPDPFKGHGIPNFVMANLLLSGLLPGSDEDGDGVPDIDGKCLGTAFPAVVGADGCPVSFDPLGFAAIVENPVGELLSIYTIHLQIRNSPLNFLT